jgi:hypothetical protein
MLIQRIIIPSLTNGGVGGSSGLNLPAVGQMNYSYAYMAQYPSGDGTVHSIFDSLPNTRPTARCHIRARITQKERITGIS